MKIHPLTSHTQPLFSHAEVPAIRAIAGRKPEVMESFRGYLAGFVGIRLSVGNFILPSREGRKGRKEFAEKKPLRPLRPWREALLIP